MSRKRQQQRSEEMRDKILAIARRIVSEEGPDALSIRRITGEMDYSAGSLYHYFRSKEEILQALLLDGYRQILSSIRTPREGLSPRAAIPAAMRRYIDGVRRWPREYCAVMFSSKPEILSVTSVLDADVREKREAMRWLIAAVETGVEQGMFTPCDPVVTAQAIWCAMFGLASRLLIEEITPGKYSAQLIDRQIDLLMKGLCG